MSPQSLSRHFATVPFAKRWADPFAEFSGFPLVTLLRHRTPRRSVRRTSGLVSCCLQTPQSLRTATHSPIRLANPGVALPLSYYLSGILKLRPIGNIHSWKLIFFIEGIITTGLGIIAYFILTDRPEYVLDLYPRSVNFI